MLIEGEALRGAKKRCRQDCDAASPCATDSTCTLSSLEGAGSEALPPLRGARRGRRRDELGSCSEDDLAAPPSHRKLPAFRRRRSAAATAGGGGGAKQQSALPHDAVVLFGLDLSPLEPWVQFAVCASGVFGFTIVYGYLQELLAVHISGRKFGLWLAWFQFGGYAFWSLVLTKVQKLRQRSGGRSAAREVGAGGGGGGGGGTPISPAVAGRATSALPCPRIRVRRSGIWTAGDGGVPLLTYVVLSVLRAVDLGMTNLAMQFLNYPAKTLIKSSRVVFTMVLGVLIGKKQYRPRDYVAVVLLVVGLGIFLHADMRSSAIFHPLGVMMLVVSLTCDGVLQNKSEIVMREYSVGQDEFQLQLYFIAFLAMTAVTYAKGELVLGIRYFLFQPGTVKEIGSGALDQDRTIWTIPRKVGVLLLFSVTGLFGSSAAGAITKRFGALSMSITSTARKAVTLFLSFAIFHNTCTWEHVAGMVIFMGALLMKSLCAATSFGNDTGLKKSDCGAKQGDLALQMGTRQTSGIEDYSLILQPEINSGDDVEVIDMEAAYVYIDESSGADDY